MPRELPNAPLVRLLDRGTPTALSDAQLAERFVADGDPEAFAVLVARHGPLVMAVCRSRLDAADAEDAFQATFLVLLNRLGTFPVGTSLAGWLRGVARRTTSQVGRERVRRRRREEAVARPGVWPESALARAELIDLVRREVDRLPTRYREPVVLCDLEGLTREEAAAALGCPPGTVGGRLARARVQLRERLERRGLDPSIPSAIPAAFRAAVESASRSAAALAAGARPTPAATAIAARLAGGWVASLKPAVAATLAAFCAGGLLAAAGPSEPPAPPKISQAAPAPPPEPALLDPTDSASAGRFTGRVLDPEGRPVPGARVFLARQPQQGPPVALGPVRGQADADGRFDFQAPDMTYEAPDLLPARRQGFLVATADGYAPDWVVTWGETRSTYHTHDDPVRGAALTMRLVRDVPIRGRLVDAEGRPVAGARVRLTSLSIPEGRDLDSHLRKLRTAFLSGPRSESIYRPEILPGVSATAETDADGRFRLEGLGGERIAYLTISASGFEEEHLTVATRETPNGLADEPKAGDLSAGVVHHSAVFTAMLKPDRTVAVSGVVRDRATGEPIAGVRLGRDWLGKPSDSQGDPNSVVTGPDGRFTVWRIRPQELEPPPPPNAMGFSRPPFQLAAVPGAGGTHLPAVAAVDRREGMVIELVRGVPFRLKVVDEEGRPVEARVEAFMVSPNAWAASLAAGTVASDPRVGLALQTAPGEYEGAAAFGPGAILVKTASVLDLRPPSVDPKGFFAPGKTDWAEQEARSSFGDRDNVILGPGWYRQDDFAAIVLVNPQVGSGPLELSATVYRDRPRTVTLLDPEGRPLTGVRADGLICRHDVGGPPLRAATANITRLDPERQRPITFIHVGRKLIAQLLARSDGDVPYTVTLQPWAAATGRTVETGAEAKGKPDIDLKPRGQAPDDYGGRPVVRVENDGRFRIDRLIPGKAYDADAYRNFKHLGKVFENLVLQPGEVRDLGRVPLSAPTP